jgi:hypothetical protein
MSDVLKDVAIAVATDNEPVPGVRNNLNSQQAIYGLLRYTARLEERVRTLESGRVPGSDSPFVICRGTLKRDGIRTGWIACLGEFGAYGLTPAEAIREFDHRWNLQP